MLNGTMGYANAQRSLDYIRVLAEFISQPEYRDVVAMFGITNELSGATIGMENVQRYYAQAYDLVRNASGAGQGPYISYSDAFWPLANWTGFMPGADRISLDTHAYVSRRGLLASHMACVLTARRSSPSRTRNLRVRWTR
jgi:glucan 1,3-beta-glucosidase